MKRLASPTNNVTVSTRLPKTRVAELTAKYPGVSHSQILKMAVDALLDGEIDFDRRGYETGLNRGYAEAQAAIQKSMAKLY